MAATCRPAPPRSRARRPRPTHPAVAPLSAQPWARRPTPWAAAPQQPFPVPLSGPPPRNNLSPPTRPPKQDIANSKYVVKPEAVPYATEGSPEAQVWAAVPPGAEGISLADLKAAVPGETGELGFRQAMAMR
jgi:hypothetical protein